MAKFENTGNVFKANISSRKVAVFTQENMSFVNDLNEQNPNNSSMILMSEINSKAAVFTRENMSFVNDFNERNPNN